MNETLENALPLAGIRVIALEQAVAAPFATRQLADLGAEVIKIERSGSGDFARGYDENVRGQSSHFVWLNRSKRSLTLDLKSSRGLEILERLLAGADVLIQNLAPGALDRLGFATERLRRDHPRLIVANLSGYGLSGPYVTKKAYDLLVQAESGFLSITGTPDAPSKAGIAVADIAGGMYAYSGVLTALLSRARTGRGTAFEVSLLEALGEWMGYPAYYAGYGGAAPQRTGGAHATIAPYGPFPTADGKTLLLGLQNDREWAAFCEKVLERPDMKHDPRFATNAQRVANRAELDARIAELCREKPLDTLMAHLDACGIANGQLREMQDFLNHPQLEARDAWQEVGTPNGPIWAMRPPVRMEGVTPRFDAIPAVGGDTDTILGELGYSEAAVRELRTAGII